PAGGGPTCGTPAVASIGDQGGVNVGAGNPINVISGNKYQREDDLPALPGVLGLEIVRHYNSAYSTAGTTPGILGRGWKLSYETDLYLIGTTLQIMQADGTRVIFSRDPNNRSLCATANPANGRLTIVKSARGEEFTWTWPDGRVLNFNSDGKLLQIVAPTGEFVSLQRDASGMLVQVTDPQGRQLRLQYPERAASRGQRFGGVAAIVSPVGTFTYRYGGVLPAASAAPASSVAANLIGVLYPDGSGRVYHSEDVRRPTFLTGISVVSAAVEPAKSGATQAASQRIATYLYDVDGRGVLTVYGTPARLQTDADGKPLKPARLVEGSGIGQVVLDFATPGQTRLTNSLGQITLYKHAIVSGEYRLLEARGAGCFQCGAVNMRYGYDRLGRLVEAIKLDSLGAPITATRIHLDAIGRPDLVGTMRYVAGQPQALQWQARHAYLQDGLRPARIWRPSVVVGREVQTSMTYNDRGQLLNVSEQGWSPGIHANERVAPIERRTTYRYSTINGRSVLIHVAGPGASGATPQFADRDSVHLQWDKDGNYPVRLITPGNDISLLEADLTGRITAISNTGGGTTRLTHDFRGRVLTSETGGIMHTIRYDASGNPLESGISSGIDEKTPYTPTARFGHDLAGRNIWTASHLGILARTRFDTESHVIEASNQSSHFRQVQTYAYDALGRPVASADSAGGNRSISWDTQGRPAVMTDALGRDRRYMYDAIGNLERTIEAANSVQASIQDTATRFQHDASGAITAVTAPSGATTRTVRDDFGRITATTSSDSGTVRRSYDAAGRLSASVDANGNRATYEYDARGRIVRQTIIDRKGTEPARQTVVTAWTYNGHRLVALDHPEQSERYEHDQEGRLVARTVILHRAAAAPITSTTHYRYGSLGELQSASLPDGSMLTYQRNGQRQLVAIERTRVRSGWLQNLLPPQTIVKDLERDIVGLKHITYGNGVQADYQRSQEGILARVVHRLQESATAGKLQVALIDALTGSGSAHAADRDRQALTGLRQTLIASPILPGALSLARDPKALIDHRYLWDVEGNLLHAQDPDSRTDHAYDAQDRLIASAHTSMASSVSASVTSSIPAARHARYFYDGAGNRLLAQQNFTDPADLRTNTVRVGYATASNRAITMGANRTATYDANGQPQQNGSRRYEWDAAGKLTAVVDNGQPLATYRYNAVGERIAKTVNGRTTRYLYEGRLLSGELDEQGRITRQYLYLGDVPVAVIDTPSGASTEGKDLAGWQAIAHDLRTIWQAWTGATPVLAYLHNNHLGATELATDINARAVWRATYGDYGDLLTTATSTQAGPADDTSRFAINLRLPGQYEDAETGLYYNDHRYYDPATGRYLTPDPLGLRGGINSYAYAANNPLKYVDPSGLILFAFDGTGNNSNADSKNIDSTNIALMYGFYDTTAAGQGFRSYQRGIGTDPASFDITNNIQQAIASSGHAFVDSQLKQFGTYLALNPNIDNKIMIDVIGFSRGAAEARDFSNRLITNYNARKYGARCLQFRFMGLFDTVSQFGIDGSNDSTFDFSIAPVWKSVAQAFALNEHRSLFPLRTIQGSSAPYIEKGFIGAHSDIGGGYMVASEKYKGDLSDVALMWMVQQAGKAGVKFAAIDERYRLVTNPIVHDERNTSSIYGPRSDQPYYENSTGLILGSRSVDERNVVTQDGKSISQTQFGGTDPLYGPLMEGLITRPTGWENRLDNCAGAANMSAYRAWLAKNYGLTINAANTEKTASVCR
ncbi:MAG: DUF2235 domain-containing protein, partial [Herminiimonas sp.]|nr:DUF2235 domain-containing protein [Herminiimonas sp.]